MKELIEAYKLPAVWAPHFIGAIISIFSPKDVLENYSFALYFVNFMGFLVPSIFGFMKNSEFSEVTGIYFAILSVFGLPFCFSLCRRPGLIIPNGQRALNKFGKFSIFYLLFGSFFSLGLFWISLINPGKPWELLPIHSSRVGLAVFGPLFALMPFYTFASFIAIVRTWCTFSR